MCMASISSASRPAAWARSAASTNSGQGTLGHLRRAEGAAALEQVANARLRRRPRTGAARSDRATVRIVEAGAQAIGAGDLRLQGQLVVGLVRAGQRLAEGRFRSGRIGEIPVRRDVHRSGLEHEEGAQGGGARPARRKPHRHGRSAPPLSARSRPARPCSHVAAARPAGRSARHVQAADRGEDLPPVAVQRVDGRGEQRIAVVEQALHRRPVARRVQAVAPLLVAAELGVVAGGPDLRQAVELRPRPAGFQIVEARGHELDRLLLRRHLQRQHLRLGRFQRDHRLVQVAAERASTRSIA